MTVIYRNMKVI